MPSLQDQLDSLTESVVCIRFNEGDISSECSNSEVEDEYDVNEMFTIGKSDTGDVSSGPRLRRDAYEQAWMLCLDRMKTVIHNIQGSTTSSLVTAIQNTYQNTLPLLPLTELPVFAVSGMDRSVTAAICQDVREELVDRDDENPGAYAITLSPPECNNILNTMKSLVSKFVASHPSTRSKPPETQARHPASFSLASYDVDVLKAWFEAVCVDRDSNPRLLVFMRDFEQHDPSVVSQFLYICAQCIPQLPFVFILSLSTPITPTSSFIHSTYSRQTLAMLKIRNFQTKSGMEVLTELIKETFFSTNFQPSVLLGASTIDFIARQCSRYTMSTDFMIAILQLVHLRHFAEPLTTFVYNELIGEDNIADTITTLEELDSQKFVQALAARLHHPEKANSIESSSSGNVAPEAQKSPRKGKSAKYSTPGEWRGDTVEDLLAHVRRSREAVHPHARQSRLAFSLFDVVRSFLVQHGLGYRANANAYGHLASSRSTSDTGMSGFEMMSASLKGTLISKEGKYMGMVIRKLTTAQLQQLMSRVYEFLHKLPSDLRQEHNVALMKLIKWMNLSMPNGSGSSTAESGDTSSSGKLGVEFAEWLLDYLSERMTDVSERNLWDIWYTGGPSIVSELLNPSPRETIVSALLHPEYYHHAAHLDHYQSKSGPEKISKGDNSEMSQDLTMLFRLYLESGKTINVFDWFQAFEVQLEAERNKAAAAKRKTDVGRRQSKKVVIGKGSKGKEGSVVPATPSKRGRRKSAVEETPSKSRSAGRPRKGKAGRDDSDAEMAGADDDAQTDSAMDVDEEESDRWHRGTLFRFMRAVQELDYLGFLKPARRKRDHVGKTVLDLAE